MMIGIGLGLEPYFANGAAGARLSYAFNSPSSGLIALPSGFSITCATTGRTCQRSASSIQKSYAANAARARNVGNGDGLSVECARTNLCTQGEAYNTWAGVGGSVVITANQVAGPGGDTVADLIDVTTAAANAGVYDISPATQTSQPQTQSHWLMSGVGATINVCNANATVGTPTFALSGTWARKALTETCATTFPWLRKTSGNTFYGGGTNVELGAYPSSYIPTAGATVARAADVLSYNAPSTLAPGGFFDVTLVFAPNYAQNETAVDHNLLYFDASNRLFYQQSTAKLVLRIGGADVLSSALTFARDQALTVRAAHTAGGRQLIVSGATSGNGASTGSAASAISLPGTVYILGGSSGAEECADLRVITAA